MSAPVIKGGALWKPGESQVTYEEQIDPLNPGRWVMVEDNESYRRWELDLGDRIIAKTEHKGTEKLIEDNQRALNESAGQRWGDGKVVGSVPMNLYFSSGLAEANKQRDTRFIRRWWDNPDHAKFRKFKGTI
jgi:hypothetical protein